MFDLEFNSTVNTVKVMLNQFVYVFIFFFCRLSFKQLPNTCAQTIVSNWKLPFLNKQKGDNH